MSSGSGSFALWAALLAIVMMIAAAPGGLCLCGDASDAATTTACGDDGCAHESRNTPHDCATGCELICCAHPCVAGAAVAMDATLETPGEWLIALRGSSLLSATEAPLLPPPRI